MNLEPRELIERHAVAFAAGDWDAVSEFWHPDAELVSPTGRWPVTAMASIARDLSEQYKDIEITVTNVFASPDQRYIAIEWTYAATRISDGARSVTPDAIIVELRDGLIVQWREYFDLSTSVELDQTPVAFDQRLGPGHNV